jgi:hypothetical protein
VVAAYGYDGDVRLVDYLTTGPKGLMPNFDPDEIKIYPPRNVVDIDL